MAMDQAAQNELYSIKQELRSIISELDDISAGVRTDFRNIGNVRCAQSIDSVTNKYRNALSRLNNMDTSKVTEEFKQSHNLA